MKGNRIIEYAPVLRPRTIWSVLTGRRCTEDHACPLDCHFGHPIRLMHRTASLKRCQVVLLSPDGEASRTSQSETAPYAA